MKYLEPSFTVGGASEAYRTGWERVFCQCEDCGAPGKRVACPYDLEVNEVTEITTLCDACHDERADAI
jgi:hypothetical protein